MLAALQEEDNGNKLLDAARRLAGGLSDLLEAAQPENREVGSIIAFNLGILLSAVSPP